MELPGGRKLDSSLFGGLKNRISNSTKGLFRRDDEYIDDAERYEDYAGDPSFNSDDTYDDYGENGYDERYANSDYDPIDTARSSSRPYSSFDLMSASSRHSWADDDIDSSSPRLVSIDDVRATTPVPDTMTRDSQSTRRTSSRSSTSYSQAPRSNLGRTMVDSSLPPQMTPEGTAAEAASRNRRSSGLDALFSSTTEPHTSVATVPSATASFVGTSASSSYVTPRANMTANQQREVTVIEPRAYSDSEAITRALKHGDMVVLALRSVPDGLAKRVLDFSFGAASAFDATVEVIDDRVFSVGMGASLTDSELNNLRTRGVL